MAESLRKRKISTPSVDQLTPIATTLKRGRLDLGVLICIRGKKIHYYNFIEQRKVSVFDDWLFRLSVTYGGQRVTDLSHLQKLVRQPLIEKIEQHQEILILEKKLDTLSNTLETQNTEIKHEISQLQSRLNSVNKSTQLINKISEQIEKLDFTNEYHVNNSLTFSNCHFNNHEDYAHSQYEHEQYESNEDIEDETSQFYYDQRDPTSETFGSNTSTDQRRGHTHQNDSNKQYQSSSHPYTSSNERSQNTSQQCNSSWFNASDTRIHTEASDTNEGDNDVKLVPVFKFSGELKSWYLERFIKYYSKFHIFDVIYSELNWLKSRANLETFSIVAQMFDANRTDIHHRPHHYLKRLFEILRTSRIERSN